MGSSVDYVNRALSMLGAELITALTREDSANAATAVDLYQPTLDQLLGRHPWRFAVTRVGLSKLTTSPAHTGYTYEYALPEGCRRVVRTDAPNGTWELYRDEASGYRRLYSNQTAVLADIVMLPDEQLFPPHFQRALQYHLAAVLAMPVTRRVDMATYFEDKAAAIEAESITQDWNEEPWREMDDGGVLADARFIGAA